MCSDIRCEQQARAKEVLEFPVLDVERDQYEILWRRRFHLFC